MEASPVVSRAPRWLQATNRSDVQVTWHHEEDVVVISLWRGGECVASAPLTVADAASLTGFLVEHLGARASAPTTVIGPVVVGPEPPRRRRSPLRLMLRSLLVPPPRVRKEDATDRITVLRR